RSFNTIRGISSLPREQKALKLRDADRLYFSPEPINRQTMNSCQQPAIAPFQFLSSRMEFPAKDKAFGLQRGERSVDFAFGKSEKIRKEFRRDWPRYFHAATQKLTDRIRPVRLVRLINRSERGEPFGGY